jgi:hypothetical protein
MIDVDSGWLISRDLLAIHSSVSYFDLCFRNPIAILRIKQLPDIPFGTLLYTLLPTSWTDQSAYTSAWLNFETTGLPSSEKVTHDPSNTPHSMR